MNRSALDPDTLNYHHLRYFWLVAREGSLSRVANRLHVSQPTISGQLKAFEDTVGAPLFMKRGRHLVPTALGERLAAYADTIFSAGQELAAAVSGEVSKRRIRLGISDQVSKLIAYRIIEPVMKAAEGIVISCREDEPRQLFGALAVHELDLVISDLPLPTTVDVRGRNHHLGDTGVAFFAAPAFEPNKLRKDFPACLGRVPLLLPHSDVAVRQQLDGWFSEQGIVPNIAGEFQDSALLKAFGQGGNGVFVAPSVIARSIERQYDVSEIGRSELVRERFYAITADRRSVDRGITELISQGKKLFQTSKRT